MRRNKYNVAPVEQRTYKNVVYDSKAECRYAEVLDVMHANGHIQAWSRQPSFILGGVRYRADFLVSRFDEILPVVVDIKGVQTAKFRQVKDLWLTYGQLPLEVVPASGRQPVEVIWPRHLMEKHDDR